ncbi:F-box/kelch-repeat protein At3g23880-like isoform X1 [Solanum tuberosum]|nr:PREDICTED: F-box/kelch-repeat protein At3g23880-like isoform X1 [Solanum tuberosum]XP_006356411.1 PREDICTED: F-box/kelch-repeat protein At3g23880-like isoform X1 [Solanum tuberosum]
MKLSMKRLLTKMKSEASHRRPKRRRLRKGTEIPSKDSMGCLPEELIVAILVRVPVKYLLQFKCVSKNWFNLISSPEFVKTHLNFSANDYTRHISLLQFREDIKYCSVSSLFHSSVNEALDLDCPMKNPPQRVYISGSVNGLVCLADGFSGLVLWNPSIRKFKKVFGFVPTQMRECWSKCGFGYDEVHNDYKVVGIFSSMIKANFEAAIYSLKSDSWRTLEDFKPGVSYCGEAKFVNHKLHWITFRRRRMSITSIDLVDEKWGKLDLPSYNKGRDLKLGVLGSDLSVLCNNDERTHSDVWVMKEYGVKASWTKLYTIRYPENYELSPPLFTYNKGEILLAFKSTLAIYDPKNDSLTYPELPNVEVTGFYNRIEAELCIESLVCPDLPNED